MAETDFDIIVVGSGCAGAVAAYTAATAGKSVLVIERGEYAGAKNMTGGRIYSHSLKRVFPDFESDAPLERKITHERLSMLDADANTTIDFSSAQLGIEGRDSYSVLRGPFDQWLSDKAEQAGAGYIYSIPVETLVKDEHGKIIGVSAGGDEITAQVTVLAEGVNALLSERSLGNPRPKPSEMAVGIKELWGVPSERIEDRFLCAPGEGAAMLFAGDCTHGCTGGGFMYTNKESISLGLVATISDLSKSGNSIYQMLDDFKRHPAVSPMVRDGELLEYSGHMVSEGGYDMIPDYTFDGCLVAGDAAMFCMNLGYMVRGMDFAVASGHIAAQAAVKAIDTGDTSKTGLGAYKDELERSFVIQDLRTFRRWPHTMENWTSMFTQYPALAKDVMNAMFVVDGEPDMPLVKRIKPIIKQYGMFKMAREAKRALKAL